MRAITRLYCIVRPGLSSIKRSRSLGSWCWDKSQRVQHAGSMNSSVYLNSRSPPDMYVAHSRTLAVEAPNTASLGYEMMNDGKMVRISWANGETAAFHSVWLRHNCQCPDCVSSANQKSINPSILDPNMSVTDIQVSGSSDCIEMSWSCGHSGFIRADWLQKHQYPDPNKTDTKDEPPVATELPQVDGSQLDKSEVLWSWLRNLNEYGVCLLTNLSTEPGTIKKVAKLVYNVQPTVYGEIFEVLTEEKPQNIAYSTDQLHLHMDLTFYESVPGLQLLHCIRNDSCVEGGESVMLDSYPVVEELRANHPKLFDTLTKVPATFDRIHYERGEPVDFVYRRPHIVLDRSGKIRGINWNGQVAGPLSVPEDEVLPYYEAYHCLANMFEKSRYKLYHRLEPGEAMTFNNRRMLHSRTKFELNGGVRHLQGIYVNIDDFKSKFQVLCKELGYEGYPVKRVFNQSM